MKTDYQKLKELLTGFGVRFSKETRENENQVIQCMSGWDKVDGYLGFFTDFEFNKEGKFIEMGIWE